MFLVIEALTFFLLTILGEGRDALAVADNPGRILDVFGTTDRTGIQSIGGMRPTIVTTGRLDVGGPVGCAVLGCQLSQPQKEVLPGEACQVQMKCRATVKGVGDLPTMQLELVRDRGSVGFREVEIGIVDPAPLTLSVEQIVLGIPFGVLHTKGFTRNKLRVEFDSVFLPGFLVQFFEHIKDFRNEVLVFVIIADLVKHEFSKLVDATYRAIPAVSDRH